MPPPLPTHNMGLGDEGSRNEELRGEAPELLWEWGCMRMGDKEGIKDWGEEGGG